MNRVKPYRLINDHELTQFQRQFTKIMDTWNQCHALFALSCKVEKTPPSENLSARFLYTSDQNQSIALLKQPDLSAISHSLFGEISDCFNTISHKYFMTLLEQLFDVKSLQKQPINGLHDMNEWHYPGATSLTMTLRGGNHLITIYIHPQWVLNHLPPREKIQQPLGDLEKALASESMHWQVELNTITLPLDDLLQLTIGDVIKTDHAITMPLHLKQQQQTLCHVDIGQANSYKSIQLTSLL